MTKAEIIDQMAQSSGMTKEEATKAFNAFSTVAEKELKKKGNVVKKTKRNRTTFRSIALFIGLSGQKLIENFLSIKVWIIFIYMGLSFVMVKGELMSGEMFATSNGSVISIVIALREAFKTQKIKAIANGASEDAKEKINNVAL